MLKPCASRPCLLLTLLLSMGISIPSSASPAQQDPPWLTPGAERVAITVTNPGQALTDYQVSVALDSRFANIFIGFLNSDLPSNQAFESHFCGYRISGQTTVTHM